MRDPSKYAHARVKRVSIGRSDRCGQPTAYIAFQTMDDSDLPIIAYHVPSRERAEELISAFRDLLDEVFPDPDPDAPAPPAPAPPHKDPEPVVTCEARPAKEVVIEARAGTGAIELAQSIQDRAADPTLPPRVKEALLRAAEHYAALAPENGGPGLSTAGVYRARTDQTGGDVVTPGWDVSVEQPVPELRHVAVRCKGLAQPPLRAGIMLSSLDEALQMVREVSNAAYEAWPRTTPEAPEHTRILADAGSHILLSLEPDGRPKVILLPGGSYVGIQLSSYPYALSFILDLISAVGAAWPTEATGRTTEAPKDA